MSDRARIDDLVRRLREAERALADLGRERDYYLLLRNSWHDQWESDLHAKLAAQDELTKAETLLIRTRDLLAGWAASHDDPGLRRRTDLLLEEVDDVIPPRDGP